jgi:hypothetical protein
MEGYIENGVYHYYLTDHLGNNRVVAKQDGVPVQKTHYYPFGSSFAVTTGAGLQPYKYNGKELLLSFSMQTYTNIFHAGFCFIQKHVLKHKLIILLFYKNDLVLVRFF